MPHSTKDELRTLLRDKRDEIELEQRIVWDRRIADRLLRSPEWGAARCVLAYCSMPGEVATAHILETAMSERKTLLLPRCVPGENRMEPASVEDLSLDLVPGQFRGLYEPGIFRKSWTELEKIDLIIVPGVAFDHQGYRLGYGKGMYDRFLPQVQKAQRIALAYGIQIIDSLPDEPHDMPMHAIITESGILEFRPRDSKIS
jgi:5-formyltetrahydrofolate cyclo-ligase